MGWWLDLHPRCMAVTDRLRLKGRVRVETFTSDGEPIGSWGSPNTLCNNGLTYLVNAIAYAGVQDIAAEIGATVSTITPLYGAIGGPTTSVVVQCNTFGTTTITPVTGTFDSTTPINTVVTGTGIPIGTTVQGVASDGTSMTLSVATTTSGATPSLTFVPPAPFAVNCAVNQYSTVITQTGDVPAAIVSSTLTLGNSTIVAASGNYASVTSGMYAISPSLPDGTTVTTKTDSTHLVLSAAPLDSVVEYVTFLPAALPGGLTANVFGNVGIDWSVTAPDIATGNGYLVNITGTSSASGVVTYSVTSNPFLVGQYVTVSDITETGSNPYSLNTAGPVVAITPTSFAIANTTTNTYVSGGSATNEQALVSYINPTARYLTITDAATNTSASESVIFAPYAPTTTDTALYNEFPTGTGRAVVEAAGGAQASSSTIAQFLWQFQFPLNSTGADITITEAGIFLLADAGRGDGVMLNHALVNPPAVWSNGSMMMLTVSIGLEP